MLSWQMKLFEIYGVFYAWSKTQETCKKKKNLSQHILLRSRNLERLCRFKKYLILGAITCISGLLIVGVQGSTNLMFATLKITT